MKGTCTTNAAGVVRDAVVGRDPGLLPIHATRLAAVVDDESCDGRRGHDTAAGVGGLRPMAAGSARRARGRTRGTRDSLSGADPSSAAGHQGLGRFIPCGIRHGRTADAGHVRSRTAVESKVCDPAGRIAGRSTSITLRPPASPPRRQCPPHRRTHDRFRFPHVEPREAVAGKEGEFDLLRAVLPATPAGNHRKKDLDTELAEPVADHLLVPRPRPCLWDFRAGRHIYRSGQVTRSQNDETSRTPSGNPSGSPGIVFQSAELMISSLTSAGEILGLRSYSNAAAPATIGAAKLVPSAPAYQPARKGRGDADCGCGDVDHRAVVGERREVVIALSVEALGRCRRETSRQSIEVRNSRYSDDLVVGCRRKESRHRRQSCRRRRRPSRPS